MLKGVLVTLKDDISEERREDIVKAIQIIKGVVNVSTVQSENAFTESLVTRSICSKISEKLIRLVEEINSIKH